MEAEAEAGADGEGGAEGVANGENTGGATSKRAGEEVDGDERGAKRAKVAATGDEEEEEEMEIEMEDDEDGACRFVTPRQFSDHLEVLRHDRLLIPCDRRCHGLGRDFGEGIEILILTYSLANSEWHNFGHNIDLHKPTTRV